MTRTLFALFAAGLLTMSTGCCNGFTIFKDDNCPPSPGVQGCCCTKQDCTCCSGHCNPCSRCGEIAS